MCLYELRCAGCLEYFRVSVCSYSDKATHAMVFGEVLVTERPENRKKSVAHCGCICVFLFLDSVSARRPFSKQS